MSKVKSSHYTFFEMKGLQTIKNVRSCLADHHLDKVILAVVVVVDARFASLTCRPLNRSNFVGPSQV